MVIKAAKRLGSVKEYYFSKKLKEIARMRAEGISILNLGIGNPDLPPHPMVIDCLQAAAQNENWHGYQSYSGIPELREAFSRWLNSYFGLSWLDADKNILPLIGSKEGIMHLSMALLGPGDKVLVPNPGYPAYAAAAELAGAEVLYYNLEENNGWQPDLNYMQTLELDKVKLMWLNYPHMPSGTSGSIPLFERLLNFAQEHNILLCHDNPYAFILNDDKPLSPLRLPDAMDHVVELHSLSKSHNMAGWRVGCLVAREDIVTTVLRFKSNMDSGMFRPLQLAAAKALSLDDGWYKSQNEVYKRRRKLVYELLDNLKCSFSKEQKGLFVWAKVPEAYKDGFSLSDRLLGSSGVFITPGGIFGSNGNEYIRVSLCLPEQTLATALERVKTFSLTQQRVEL